MSANVRLEPVPVADKAALKAMLDAYLAAHAEQVDPQRAGGDPTDYPYFDLYWREPARRPFWIVADGERAGFVMINAWSPTGRGTDNAVAEFYVAPEKRRQGIGLAAAVAALRSAPGWWELQVYRANPAGMSFWRRAIAAAGPSTWERIPLEDRVLHRFRREPAPAQEVFREQA